MFNNRKKSLTIEDYLLANNYIIHNVINEGDTTVYNKNMQTILITKRKKKNRIAMDLGGEELFSLGFIPSSTIFEIILKSALKESNN